MQARRQQWQAGQRAHLQLELRDIAGIDRVVAAVVRARRHLVGEQGAVIQHEELDAQHADVCHRRGNALGRGERAPLDRGVQRRRHDRHRQDAAAVQVALRRKVHQLARCVARDDNAQLGGERQPSLEHAAPASKVAPGRGELRAIIDRDLAFAVVAELRRLQQPGQQRGIDGVELRIALDHRVRRTRHAAALELRLLGGAVLADRHRVGARRDRPVRAERDERLRRHVLELGGDRRAALHQLREALLVEVVGTGGDTARRGPPGSMDRGRAPRRHSPSPAPRA